MLRTNLLVNETESSNIIGGLSEKEKKKLFSVADRHLLELAQISIKSDRHSRLIDLAQLASNEKTIDLMIQLCKHYKLISLIDELETLKIKIFKSKFEEPLCIVNLQAQQSEEILKDSLMSLNDNDNFSTPKIQFNHEIEIKESPKGILANLTPLKIIKNPINASIDNHNPIAESPIELASSPLNSSSNPFVKLSNENKNTSTINEDNVNGNVMLDYISAMIKMNNNGSQKRKPEELITFTKPSSSISGKTLNKQ